MCCWPPSHEVKLRNLMKHTYHRKLLTLQLLEATVAVANFDRIHHHQPTIAKDPTEYKRARSPNRKLII